MTLLSITRQLTSQGVVKRLQKEQTELQCRSLAFFEVVFDEAIAQAFLSLLQKYYKKQRPLAEWNLYECPGNQHMDQCLRKAHYLDLFSSIRIRGNRTNGFLSPSLGFLGSPSIRRIPLQHYLTKLQFSDLTISREDAEALQTLLQNTTPCINNNNNNNSHRGGSRSPPSSSQLQQLCLSRIRLRDDGAFRCLLEGFSNNKTLRELALLSCGLSDEAMANILESLTSHPSLKTLRLFGNQCRSLGIQGVVHLLSHPNCQLESLDLHHQRVSTATSGLPIEQLLEGWHPRRRNTTLRRLVLSGNQLVDQDMRHLSMLLRRLPFLEELDLDSNLIHNDGLRLFAESSISSSRLRALRMMQNPLTEAASLELLKLVQIHPQLHSFAPMALLLRKSTAVGKKITHFMDMNYAGRVLLQQRNHHNSIPLSVWPKVLARLTNNPIRFFFFLRGGRAGCHSNVNGIYYLLRHGPLMWQPDITTSSATTTTTIEESSSTERIPQHQMSRSSRKRKRESM